MRVLFVHPSPLMYSEVYLRLEPLGVERVAAALLEAGHDVRLIDLQLFTHRDFFREMESFKPQAIGFSLNYLANVPEVVDLAKATRKLMPECFIFVGGHSGSFIAGHSETRRRRYRLRGQRRRRVRHPAAYRGDWQRRHRQVARDCDG